MATGNVYLGVDIGGTKVAVNGIDEQRKPLAKEWLEVPSHSDKGPEATIGQIVAGLKAYLEREKIDPKQVIAVGLDSPGPADIDGKIERSANMHPAWEGFQLRENAERAVSKALGHEVRVSYENDCNAAALWESHIGNPEGKEAMALLAPGTGLGGGIVINGRLLRGARGMGAELGHVEIVHPPFIEGWEPKCGCGQTYCTEAYASMAALGKILRIALPQAKYKNHPLNQISGANDDETWKKRAYGVRGLAAKSDELCQGIFDWQSQAIGKLSRQVADTIDPDRIVIGGGFIEGGAELTGRIMKIIQETFKKYSFKKHAAEVKFEVARSGDQAGGLGAALSAWQFANRK
jgi:predicted NBD/HSP70 family sugar kinase